MNDPSNRMPPKAESKLAEEIGIKAERKLKARRRIDAGDSGVWFGLGMMGLVGWSVAVPTLLGSALGVWLDKHYPNSHSWTLSLLVAGLMLGCINAWHWVAKEEKAMKEEPERETEEEGDEHE